MTSRISIMIAKFFANLLPAITLACIGPMLASTSVSAQAPTAPNAAAAPAPFFGYQGPKSPEIGADGSVTFRLKAPDASAVTLSGSWHESSALPMKKGDDGLWELTVQDIKPEVWTYTFNVDGTRMLDPGNVYVQRDGARYLNMLLVPGDGSALYGEGDVPHGTIHEVWYASPTLSMTQRRMYVYTPAGYEDSKEKYPVLYLLHGAGGDEDAWDNMGRAHEIMDHLIASGKAKPMLVVMTNGNWNQIGAPGTAVQAPPPQGGPNQITAPGQITPAMQFSESVVADVIPFVEKHYRVTADRDHRAIAGLSMGGAQTLYAGLNHLDKFSYVASFSGALTMWPGARKLLPPVEGVPQRGPGPRQALAIEGVETTFPNINASANAKLHLLYISCGMDDGLLSVDQQFMDWLTTKGVKYEKVLTPGYSHQWSFWRISLADYASQLFTGEATVPPANTTAKIKSRAGA